jgi:hypothetical protein
VVALVGALRYQQHQSVPQIHQHLLGRGVCVSERSVSNLLGRYDQLLAVHLGQPQRIQSLMLQRVILAIDRMQPDVGHEVLWVIRECISGKILLVRTLLSATHQDIAA